MKKTHIKICCIGSVEEASLAISAGATALGLVGHMTSETDIDQIIQHHSKVNTTTIQIVDELTNGTHVQLKGALPSVKIVQVLHILDETSIEKAIRISKNVDAILLDSGNPNLNTKELGGTGRTHNWEISKTIVEKVEIPVFLAGGLNPENAAKALNDVNPYGLDLCSGVRTNGNLDIDKLTSFFKAINNTI